MGYFFHFSSLYLAPRPFFIIIFKLKNGNFKTRDFSTLVERVLAGVIADKKKKSYCCNVIDRWRGILIVPYCVPGYYVVCWSLRRAKKKISPQHGCCHGRAHGGPRGLVGLPFSGAPVNDMVGF